MFFTPSYLKQAKLLLKGATRFMDYKRDLLPAKKLEEIESLRSQLKVAIKEKDGARIDALTAVINTTCERALPDTRVSAFAENVEVFFVSIVIAMGIRAYIAQPFQIPTGSMQPTLSGINARTTSVDEPSPGMTQRIGEWFTGRSYVNVIADRDANLDPVQPFTEKNWDISLWPLSFSILTPHTVMHLDDGGSIVFKGPKDKVLGDLGLGANLKLPGRAMPGMITPDGKPVMYYDSEGRGQRTQITKGQLLARGIVDWGDQVVVNKFAYHFRTPTRGEVFVFTTKNIDPIWNRMSPSDKLGGSQHYIKRLGGVPGDKIEVHEPQLFINGKLADEAGFKRVMTLKDGYKGYEGRGSNIECDARHFAALGDNSFNSYDSRYWGPIQDKNLVGPGWFCYWPLTKHWGLIR